MDKYKKKLKVIFKSCFEPYMRILPGNVAYSLMISVVPILSLVVMICNSINLSSDLILSKLGDIVPSNILSTLLEYMDGSTLNSVILIIAGIWAASMGANALIIASNMIYKYENSTYVERRVKAFILTILLIIVVIINLVFLVFGNELLKLAFSLLGINVGLVSIYRFIKWPISFILIYLVVKILYTACPDKHIKSKTVTHGAIFTTCAWMLTSAIYSFYISHFANYGKVYGGLANIIILMIWLYMLSFVLVVGIAINVSDYKDIKE